LIERDPTGATYACHCASTADPARAAALTLRAWFDDGMLRLRLVARAAGAPSALGPQFRLALPRSGVTVGRFAASDATEVGLVLRRADTALRFAAHQEPTRPIAWSTETEGSDVIYAVSATPLGGTGGDGDTAVLTVTVGPAG
jgi:hypothetical protein